MEEFKKRLFITGTDTGVGKTVVTAAIAGILTRKGYNTGVMKPVQTGCRRTENGLIGPDLEFLTRVVTDSRLWKSKPGTAEQEITKTVYRKNAQGADPEAKIALPDAVYSFEPPVSPDLAARLAGQSILPDKIIKAYEQISAGHDITLVEGIGGLMVPLGDGYLVRDLILDMDIPVIIVARPGLGTLNHTLLTLETARNSDIDVVGVVVNGSSPDKAGLSEQYNPETIARLGRTKILGVLPFIPDLDVESGRPGKLIEIASSCLDLSVE